MNFEVLHATKQGSNTVWVFTCWDSLVMARSAYPHLAYRLHEGSVQLLLATKEGPNTLWVKVEESYSSEDQFLNEFDPLPALYRRVS